MPIMQRLYKTMAAVLTVTMCFMSLPHAAYAGIVGTGEILSGQQSQVDRAQLLSALERQDVRDQLTALGVDPAQAAERVAGMTDEEVQSVAGKMGDLPAGGDLLGALVFIFVLLLVTDILGFTNVYPFVKKTVH